MHRADRTPYRATPTVRAMGAGLRARRSDGSQFRVEISLSPLRLGDDEFVVASVRDITMRVQADDQLHRVLRTLDASDHGVFIFDAATLRFSFVHDGAARLVGYRRDELLTMTPLHLNPYTTHAEYHRLVESLLADRSSSIVRRSVMLRKDGSEVAVEETLHAATGERDGSQSVITVARDITARLATEAELEQHRQARTDAERALAVADDRERIARDLHDTVIQRLFAAGLGLQAALGHVADPDHTRDRPESTIDGIDKTIRELRQAVYALQGPTAAPPGLRQCLLHVVTDAADGLGFEPRVQFDGPIDTIDDHIAEQVTPVLREALTNIARHAHARNVRIAITVNDDVTLTVTDDGIGVPADVLGGRGLTNLAERARALGGNFTIDPQPTGGSHLTWRARASHLHSRHDRRRQTADGQSSPTTS